MKNQKGFIVPLLLAIIALLVIGGGAIYFINHQSISLVATSKQVATVQTSLDASESFKGGVTLDNQKILVLLINYLDSGPEPFTKAQANKMIFNGQTQKFYKEQSYGKFSLNGDVYGWDKVQKNTPTRINGEYNCTGSIDSSDFGQIIKKNRINLNKYDNLFIIMNGSMMSGCETGVGKSNVIVNGKNFNISVGYIVVDSTYSQPDSGVYNGSTLSPAFSWTIFDGVLSHELGHALGLQHSNGLDCGDQIFAGTCQSYEYGNPFSIMGMAAGGALHFPAFYKELLGWIKPASEIVITKSGRYTINPIETVSGKKLAKIRLPGDDTPSFLYLEYRRAIGFDSRLNEPIIFSNQNGLLINVVNVPVNGTTHVDQSMLLDMTPGPTSSFGYWISSSINSSLNENNTFSVPDSGIIIGPIIKNDARSITFDVKI